MRSDGEVEQGQLYIIIRGWLHWPKQVKQDCCTFASSVADG